MVAPIHLYLFDISLPRAARNTGRTLVLFISIRSAHIFTSKQTRLRTKKRRQQGYVNQGRSTHPEGNLRMRRRDVCVFGQEGRAPVAGCWTSERCVA
jgi:hypothetical protein